MEDNEKTIRDFLDILKRRKTSLVLSMLVVPAIAVIVLLLMPRTYRSTSTILIEEQEIPKEFVVATVSSYAEQRLQSINQRIMSSGRLIDIMNKFNLYADRRRVETTEEVVARMRKDIKFQTISADVVDPRTGRPTSATIAFSLSYQGRNPEAVQQVANILTSLYLEENLKVREQQTAGASKFLEEEAANLQAELAKVEGRIAAFKRQNIETLPELLQSNLQGLDRMENELERLRDQLRTFKEREDYLQIQLASIPTDMQNQDKTLLKELKARLVQLQSRVSDKYPDVKKTKSEIAELEKRIEASGGKGEGRDGAREKTGLPDQPDNPAFVTLSAQLAGARSEITSVQRQIVEIEKRRDGYRQRTAATPRVEETYKALTIERNNMQAKYDDLRKKVMEARVAHGLEKGQMGERFTLIDPAKLPEKPVSPNIPAVLLISVVLGIGAGVGNAALREHSDTSAHTSQELERSTGFSVLGSVPFIKTNADRMKLVKQRKIVAAGTVAALIVFLILFHFFVMDLTVLISRVMRRTGV